MTSIAIITARGGSKRIHRKNIKLFCDKPIIEYSIQTAIDSNLFSEIMVSTDDAEIAEVAMQAGAKVPFLRSPENSNDYAGTADAICEVIESYKALNIFFDKGCCIYPTAPLVNKELLHEGYNLLTKFNYDVVFPSIKYSYPIQRSVSISSDNKIEMLWPENYAIRSQDFKPVYHDAGQFYWFDTNTMLEKRKLFTNHSGSVIISELMAQDIDTIEDWEIAEIKYKLLKGN